MVGDIPLHSSVLVVAVLESKFPAPPQEGGWGWEGVQFPRLSGARQARVSLVSDRGVRSKDFISAHVSFS